MPLLTAFIVTSVDESTAKFVLAVPTLATSLKLFATESASVVEYKSKFVLASAAVIAPVPPSEIGIKSAATNSASPVTAEPVNVALIGVFDAISYP